METTQIVWMPVAEDIVRIHQFVHRHRIYELIDGSIHVPSGYGMPFPLGGLHAYTYNQQVVHLTEWLSDNCGMNDEGPTLSVTLDRRDTTEEEKLQFEQLEQFIHQLQSIKGAVPKYTRTGRKSDTLLITFKNTGALWRLTGRRTSHLLAV